MTKSLRDWINKRILKSLRIISDSVSEREKQINAKTFSEQSDMSGKVDGGHSKEG
jgi:hypothetical protein